MRHWVSHSTLPAAAHPAMRQNDSYCKQCRKDISIYQENINTQARTYTHTHTHTHTHTQCYIYKYVNPKEI